MSKRILSGIVGLVCLLSGCRKAVNVETNHIPLFHFTTVMNWTGEPARRCGCPCCPADACSDIKEISTYISACNGGDGVGRDVVEQVLRAKGLWLSDAKAFGW